MMQNIASVVETVFLFARVGAVNGQALSAVMPTMIYARTSATVIWNRCLRTCGPWNHSPSWQLIATYGLQVVPAPARGRRQEL